MARSSRSPPRQASRYATRSPSTEAEAAHRISTTSEGTCPPVPSPAPLTVVVPAAAAVAAVMTRTPLGSRGRKTSSRTERATTA